MGRLDVLRIVRTAKLQGVNNHHGYLAFWRQNSNGCAHIFGSKLFSSPMPTFSNVAFIWVDLFKMAACNRKYLRCHRICSHLNDARFATYMYVFALLEVNATILSGAQNHRGLRIKDGGRKPIILMLWNQYNVVSPKRPTLKNLSYRERLKCLNIYLRTSTTPYRFCFGYKIVCACRPHIGVDLSARLGGHNRG